MASPKKTEASTPVTPPAPPAPTTYTVVRPIAYRRAKHAVGAVIEIDADTAKALLDCGAVQVTPATA